MKDSNSGTYRPHKDGMWWLLLIVFILLPIPWGPWWVTVVAIGICALLGWMLFGREKRSAAVDQPPPAEHKQQ